METDIYQKLTMDYGDETPKAIEIINNLDSKTKGMISAQQIRALIYGAKANLGILRVSSEKFEYNNIIQNNPDIDFTKTFHELGMMKK